MDKNHNLHRYVNTADYEVKTLLIALRKIYDISEHEMARVLNISKITLQAYEYDSIVNSSYTDKYIEVLDEYVSYAARRKMSFVDAIGIYKRQKCLYKYPMAYKVALFGSIFYDSTYVEFFDYGTNNQNVKNLGNKENTLNKSNGETISSSEKQDYVWSNSKYQMAFYILKTMRNMLEVSVEKIVEDMEISITTFRYLEKSVETYKGGYSVYKVIKDYAEYLEACLREKGEKLNVYEAICYTLKQENFEEDNLKMVQVFFRKLYEK